MKTKPGADYAACGIEALTQMQHAPLTAYSTAIREGARADRQGAGHARDFLRLAPQAGAVVKGVRLREEEWTRTRCMIVDSAFRVIAASDGQDLLTERFRLQVDGRQTGSYQAGDGTIVSFAATPGYETYHGLGWHGLICQKPG